METLWDLLDRPLAYRSRETAKLTEDTGVTLLGPSAMQVPEAWRVDRCVRDPNLLRNIHQSCKTLLQQYSLSPDLNTLYDHVVEVPYPPMGHSMNIEEDMKAYLGEHWLQGTELTLNEVLSQTSIGGSFELIRGASGRGRIPDCIAEHRHLFRSLVEAKAESVMNEHLDRSLERPNLGSEIVWGDHLRAGSNTTNLLYKIAIHLGTYERTWLCLTSLSCMLTPFMYLITRDASQWRWMDAREPLDWMPTLIATCLWEIASDDSGLSFDVPLGPVPICESTAPPEGYPVGYPSGYGSGSETGTSSNSDDTSDKIYYSTDDSLVLVFVANQDGNPRGLSAPLILGTPSLSVELSPPPPPRRRYFSEVDARRLTLPKLKLTNEIGQGSIGQVFNAQSHDFDAIAKISWHPDARKRLQMEASTYVSLINQRQVPQEKIYRELPLFLGWYRGHSFDLMILTAEGQSCEGETWKSLSRAQRYDLYPHLRTFHESGFLRGDVHPRNTVIAQNGQVRLVDLSGASKHKCPEPPKMFPMIGARSPSSPQKCAELKLLHIALRLKAT